MICFKPEHIKDSTTWDELSDELKNEMSNKLVSFQGNKVKLFRCCNHLHHLIDGKFLKELEKGNTPTLVNNQVPDQVKYYIQRNLQTRSKLKSSVFQQACNDIFVVEGMEKHQLNNLVSGIETDVSGNPIKNLTVRFVLLENEGDFERICKLASSPVHLIRYKHNTYEWVKSAGSVKNLQKHVHYVQDTFPELDLASREDKVNLIPDSPGAGKTGLLGNVAHHISKEKPHLLIRFLIMKDLVQELVKKPINLESIHSMIAEQSSKFECGRNIVKQILANEPCILMFDGFDEVLPHQIYVAKEVLKTIVTMTSAQVFITTRPHLREELENILNVLGFMINPFTESDQVEFLLNFWQIKGATVNENLKQFATSCVSAISSEMPDFERNIAGVPLQCKLLAETYTEQAIRCSETNSQPIIQINSIFEKYESHMKMRLENCTSPVEAIKNCHMYHALELLFPEHAQQFRTLKNSSVPLNEICTIGFLEATNSKDVRFVHRTFAEFFVAWFAVEVKTPENNLSFLLNELLATKSNEEFLITPFGKADLGPSFTFNNPVIAYFINGFTKMYVKNHGDNDQTHRVSMLMDSEFYSEVSRIFIASQVNDCQFVPLVVSLRYEPSQLNQIEDSDVYKLLLISAKYSSVALMQVFCFQKDLTKFKCHFTFHSFELTPLHVAVQCGHYNVAEFLVQKYGQNLKNLQFLLHFCVFNSLAETRETIKDKVRVIKLLSRESIYFLDEKLSDGTVPLFQKNVHSKLIKSLIKCGADINLVDQHGNTILHKITENPVTPELYHWLVVSLGERKFKHFNHPNSYKISPLHCALEKVELLQDTLKCLLSNDADINALDNDGETPLFHAIRGGRSANLIRSLIELGSDWKILNKTSESLLHMCAKHGHYYALKYFVKTLKLDVNAKDVNCNTPLHFAVMKRSEDYELMQRLLINCGADVNARNQEYPYNTPFKKALKQGKGLSLHIIKLMEEHGLSHQADKVSQDLTNLLSNRNIMSWEMDEEFVQVLHFLIKKGGKIKNIKLERKHTTSDSEDTTSDSDGTNLDRVRCIKFWPQYINIWKAESVRKNIHAIIKATDISSFWAHVKASGLLTEFEFEKIHNLPTDSLIKSKRFYKIIKAKQGSFEQFCILMLTSNQMNSFLLLRQSLYAALKTKNQLFVTPPTFTNQFVHSQPNFGFNMMALITKNPYFTIRRIQDTINENFVLIHEAKMSSTLQKKFHEDLIVVKVRVVTTKLIAKLKESGTQEMKIIFVCSRVTEDVENCQVATDSLTSWDDFSTNYLNCNGTFSFFRRKTIHPLNKILETPLMLNKISQLQRNVTFVQAAEYTVVRAKAGHIDMKFQSKSYLNSTIFHCVLPDKLVFKGISIEKLKEFAHFGHKIGTVGGDSVDNLDFVVIEQSYQFDEICMQTSENVHLVEYEHEKDLFKLVKTWGWEENIQWYLQKPLCEGFPLCYCAPVKENLVVKLLVETEKKRTLHRFECLFPINELTLNALESMKLENTEMIFMIRGFHKRLGGQQDTGHAELIGKSHREQIVQLVTENLSKFLVENELFHVAINTLFPNLAKNTTGMTGLEKYQQLGMLKQISNNSMVFEHQSLAWYFIAKLLMGLTETTEFEEITDALRSTLFQNCFEPQKVTTSEGSCVRVNPYDDISSYWFINGMCFMFIDALLAKNSHNDNSSISSYLKIIIAADTEEYRWIHACVNANLIHLLELIISSEINPLSPKLNSKDLIVLAVNHAGVPVTQLVAGKVQEKGRRYLAESKLYLHFGYYNKEISLMHLAAMRGNSGLVEYLLSQRRIECEFQEREKLCEVSRCCVAFTGNISGYEVNERKRIVDLVIQPDAALFNDLTFSKDIHVDLIVHLFTHGVDIHTKNYWKQNILHLLPAYLTPQEYHEVVQKIHARDNTNIARLFLEFNVRGETAFHVAVQNLELLDETLAIFSEAGVNFNALNETKISVFVHAVKHSRSARALDTLYRFGADIGGRDNASFYWWGNHTALRYLGSRGVQVADTDEDKSRAKF